MNEDVQGRPFWRGYFWIAFAAASLLIAFRDPDWWVHPQFFAEDGKLFFGQQTVLGVRAFLVPYAGYLHFVPRVVAWSASPLPVVWQPLYFQTIAILLAGACIAYFVLPECRFLIASDEMRMAVCILAAADTAGADLFGNVATIAVILFPVGLLLLLNGRESVMRAIMVAAIVLTSPGLILFWPLSLWRVIRQRSLVAASFLICATIQLAVLVVAPNAQASPNVPPLWLSGVAAVETLAYRVIVSSLSGMPTVVRFGESNGLVFSVVMVAVAAVLFGVLVRTMRLERREAWVFYSCVILGALILWEPFVIRRDMLDYFSDMHRFFFTGGARYFYMPVCLFLVVAALAIEKLFRPMEPRWRASLLLALFAYGTCRNYFVAPLADLHWPVEAARIEKWKQGEPGQVVVFINPKGWAIVLP